MAGRPPDYPHLDPARAFAAVAPKLRLLREAGILASLDDERARRLLERMPRPGFWSHLLAFLIEMHLRNDPGEDIVVERDDFSAATLERAMKRSFSTILWNDAKLGYVHLVGRGCMAPKGERSWLTVFEAALAHVGDSRRFVSLFMPDDYEERVYLLVTDPQARVLASLGLLSERLTKSRRMPAVIPGREAPPPSVLALVDALRRKGVTATASGTRIAVELALPAGGDLITRLRTDIARRTGEDPE